MILDPNCTCEVRKSIAIDGVAMAISATIDRWNPECPVHQGAKIITFRESGKYYTEEKWEIPKHAIGPYHMADSGDYELWRAAHPTWFALVPDQEPWGYPHLLAPDQP